MCAICILVQACSSYKGFNQSPAQPVAIAWDYLLLAGIIAIVTAVFSRLPPAHRAAALSPVDALRSE
jgi:ABC-type lipoprotein release transport system permease subunit